MLVVAHPGEAETLAAAAQLDEAHGACFDTATC